MLISWLSFINMRLCNYGLKRICKSHLLKHRRNQCLNWIIMRVFLFCLVGRVGAVGLETSPFYKGMSTAWAFLKHHNRGIHMLKMNVKFNQPHISKITSVDKDYILCHMLSTYHKCRRTKSTIINFTPNRKNSMTTLPI